MSPSGEWVVAVGTREGGWGVLVQHRGDGVKHVVYRSDNPIWSPVWIGANTLLVRHNPRDAVKAVALHFEWDGTTVLDDRLDIRVAGSLVDPLNGSEDDVLWTARMKSHSVVEHRSVHGFGVWRRRGRIKHVQSRVVAQLHEAVLGWISDHRGVVRAAIVYEGGADPRVSIHYRDGSKGRWREVWRGSAIDPEIRPFAVTDEGRLVVRARGEGDTLGLFEFDPETRELGKEIYRHPDLDITGVILDPSGAEIIAVAYADGGDQKWVYFDEFRDAHLPDFDRLGLGSNVLVTGSSRDYRFLTLLVRGPSEPGVFYFYDRETGKLTTLGAVNFDVRSEWLSSTETQKVVSEDGTEVEAFLTRPKRTDETDGKKPPLLVLPHGGPVGVRDDRSFDPLTQMIAHAGIAVLKVNYRGSSGYGKAFEDAGKREWGRGIEDDIEAAVRMVVDAGLVDADRMCIGGMSYGGYSALMSAIRDPERYRCVITIAGVTDIPLVFMASDFSAFEISRKGFAEIVGDLEADYDDLVAVSPVYLADRLEVPVLIIHGTKDRRVDPEHARRLRAMLALHGKPFQWESIAGAGHGFSSEQFHRVGRTLIGFMKRNIRAPSP